MPKLYDVVDAVHKENRGKAGGLDGTCTHGSVHLWRSLVSGLSFTWAYFLITAWLCMLGMIMYQMFL